MCPNTLYLIYSFNQNTKLCCFFNILQHNLFLKCTEHCPFCSVSCQTLLDCDCIWNFTCFSSTAYIQISLSIYKTEKWFSSVEEKYSHWVFAHLGQASLLVWAETETQNLWEFKLNCPFSIQKPVCFMCILLIPDRKLGEIYCADPAIVCQLSASGTKNSAPLSA